MESPKIIAQLRSADIQRNGKVVLSKVNLDIAEAEFCYLVGQTGSGKSSLLKTLFGANPLLSGEGNVTGYSLNDLDHKMKSQLRRNIGMIFQDFALFGDWTVSKNLEYIMRATDWKNEKEIQFKIQELLEAVSLIQYRDELVDVLSGGEQQRLAVARSIINTPKLLIADEPTGNLDPDSTDSIIKLIRKLTIQHKTATIFATHDYRIIEKYPARVFKCEDAKLIEV